MKLDGFIKAEKIAGRSVKRACDLFEVSRAAFYQRGLGLAIVARIVERHGGHVHVDTAGKGTGAAITVVLPALAAT